MLYDTELRFLCDTLQKCHIQTHIIDMSQPLTQRLSQMDIPTQLGDIDGLADLESRLPQVRPGVVYRFRDQLGCHFLYCCLPTAARESLLAIGPYLAESPDSQQILELAEKHGVSPGQLKYLQNYYNSIPVLPNANHLFALVETFAERLWGKNGFTVEDVFSEPYELFLSPEDKKSPAEDTLWYMRSIEQRYAYENELIEAVSKGHSHKADMIYDTFSHLSLEQRSNDPLRNAKNYCIIMNTLLRKAAEQGGVHPMNLDRVSSGFAFRIEQAVSLESVPGIFSEMFHTYCRLVRKNSLKGYSPPVQRAVALIEADLSASLNLRTIAHNLNISSSYLSSLFKKETGQTLTDYIILRRMDLARNLLSRTKLQVQTVAQHCGILDVHYFSKLFKKATGMTPKEFRQVNSSN